MNKHKMPPIHIPKPRYTWMTNVTNMPWEEYLKWATPIKLDPTVSGHYDVRTETLSLSRWILQDD